MSATTANTSALATLPKHMVDPFDPGALIGSIVQIDPGYARINLPKAAEVIGSEYFGSHIPGGEIGEIVAIECDETAIIGRIIEIKLPEGERLTVEPRLGKRPASHPIGTVQLLATMSLSDGRINAGLKIHPRVGSRVYSANRDIQAQGLGDTGKPVTLTLGTAANSSRASVKVTPDQLFGRHCAILGTTGSGKSYTIARLIESSLQHNSKIILIDPTGEYQLPQGDAAIRSIKIGSPKKGVDDIAHATYRRLSVSELFGLLTPTAQAQAPVLRAAITTLKLIEIGEGPYGSCGDVLDKAGKERGEYEAMRIKHAGTISTSGCAFNIMHLADQIKYECVKDSKPEKWGKSDGASLNYCNSLIMRVEHLVTAVEYRCVFSEEICNQKTDDDLPSIYSYIDKFCADPTQKVLRICLEDVPFGYNVREVVVNGIARDILHKARKGTFNSIGQVDSGNSPRGLTLILDEAHQFMNRQIGDETVTHRLDAFDTIAKEGRKYWLNLCLATQRPRDLPEGVISQMGSLLVHRMINEADRRVVQNAASEMDRSAERFLPVLAPGQALVLGVDMGMPTIVDVRGPSKSHEPKSSGTDFQNAWLVSDHMTT